MMDRKENIQKPILLDHSSLRYPLPRELIADLSEQLEYINDYPSGGAYQYLSGNLANYAGVKPEYILPANGSDEVIEALTRAFGKKLILIPVPTFSQYEASADRNHYRKKLIPCLNGEDYRLNFHDRDLNQASLVWICNPNNPTGNEIPRKEIERILTKTKGIVAVDECNYEYLGQTVVDLIDQYPNLIILRSFSKNFGLAGLRLGFAIGSPNNIKKIQQYCQEFRVNKMAEIAGSKVLKYLDYYQNIWQKIASVREEFTEGLHRLGIKVFLSQTNFILVDFLTRQNTLNIWKYLKQQGVHTFFGWNTEFSGLDSHYIRFTIGTEQEMEYVLMLLAQYQKESKR